VAKSHPEILPGVFNAAELNRDKVPGLGGVADNLGSYFKKSPKAAK